MSKSTASRICKELRDRYATFMARELSAVKLVALSLDAIYLPVRPLGAKEGVLCAWGISETGERVLLAVMLAVALEPAERQNHLLGLKKPEADADWLTDDGVRSALRGAALRLGQETVTEKDYHVERKKIAAADRRRRRHGGQLRMPSYKEIKRKAGSWSAALRLAGLKTA